MAPLAIIHRRERWRCERGILPIAVVDWWAGSWSRSLGVWFFPLATIYKSISDYDAKTQAKGLSAHLAYGSTTGAAFAALTR